MDSSSATATIGGAGTVATTGSTGVVMASIGANMAIAVMAITGEIETGSMTKARVGAGIVMGIAAGRTRTIDQGDMTKVTRGTRVADMDGGIAKTILAASTAMRITGETTQIINIIPVTTVAETTTMITMAIIADARRMSV